MIGIGTYDGWVVSFGTAKTGWVLVHVTRYMAQTYDAVKKHVFYSEILTKFCYYSTKM